MRFENLKFRPAVKVHAEGTVFIGYVSGTLVVPDAQGNAIRMYSPNLELKVMRDGDVRVDFKSVQGKDGVWRPVVVLDYASKTQLLNVILADRIVSAVVISIIEDIDRGHIKFNAA